MSDSLIFLSIYLAIGFCFACGYVDGCAQEKTPWYWRNIVIGVFFWAMILGYWVGRGDRK